MDFDDLIMMTLRLFDKILMSSPIISKRYQYIHVDEYQDTNHAQYQLVKLLASRFKNICVVGDADQSIYGWRGADMQNILDFEKDYPEAKVVLLEENYRSTKKILQAANEVIKNNRKPPVQRNFGLKMTTVNKSFITVLMTSVMKSCFCCFNY
ncbi:MAG: UvrD-helicase domain-containing protein [Streptococcus salivarius]